MKNDDGNVLDFEERWRARFYRLDERTTTSCGNLSISGKQMTLLRDQIDLKERRFPTFINQFGGPEAGHILSLPWLLQKMLDRAFDDEIRAKNERRKKMNMKKITVAMKRPEADTD